MLPGDIVVRRAGWLARALRESCPAWLQAWLGAERQRPIAVAARYSAVRPGRGGPLSSIRLAAARRRSGLCTRHR
jgi:hypothetical protein